MVRSITRLIVPGKQVTNSESHTTLPPISTNVGSVERLLVTIHILVQEKGPARSSGGKRIHSGCNTAPVKKERDVHHVFYDPRAARPTCVYPTLSLLIPSPYRLPRYGHSIDKPQRPPLGPAPALVRLSMNCLILAWPSARAKKQRFVAFSQTTTSSCFAYRRTYS